MHIQSSPSPANKVPRRSPSRYRYRCSANVYESTSTRAAGDRVFRCTYHKRTCLDVWSAYAAIMRRLSTKCFTKLHRGFRILAYVRSRRLEPNVRQKSDLEARARRQKRRGCDHKYTIDELTPCGRRKTSRQSHFPLNNSSGCDGIRPPSVMRFCVTEE